jgi:hypothetical protein
MNCAFNHRFLVNSTPRSRRGNPRMLRAFGRLAYIKKSLIAHNSTSGGTIFLPNARAEEPPSRIPPWRFPIWRKAACANRIRVERRPNVDLGPPARDPWRWSKDVARRASANPRPQENSIRQAFLWRNAPFHGRRIHHAFHTLSSPE